jgi:hypothetical protein
MFSLDDRAGNVVTTVVLVMTAAFFLLLSLLTAYLREMHHVPCRGLTWVQEHSRHGQKNRTWAIAQVYLIGMLVLGSLGYEYGPHLAAQIRSLNAAVPEILQGPVSLGRAWLERRSTTAATGTGDSSP